MSPARPAGAGARARARKPRVIPVLGCANVLFGCLGLGCLGVGLSTIRWDLVPPGEPVRDALNRSPYYEWLLPLFVGLLLSLALLSSGIGLLQRRPWGRRLAMGLACADLVLGLGFLLFAAVFLSQAFQVAQAGADDEVLVAGTLATYVRLLYSLIVLVILNRRAVRDAFQKRQPS